MRIAVTGANGHVGSNLCKALTAMGYEINALIHSRSDSLSQIPVSLYQGDILNKSSLLPFLSGCHAVFHLAARISISGDKDGMVRLINHEGTINVIEAARKAGVKKFIHFSSIHACMQNPVSEPLDESRPLVTGNGTAYDLSKAAGETEALKAASDEFQVVILSPTAIIGPGDFEPSLAGKAVIDICNNRIPMLIPGGYDWVDVRDVVSSAIAALDNGRNGEKYLLSGHWHSLQQFSEIIGRKTGRKTVRLVAPMWLARTGLPFINLYSLLTRTQPVYTSESLTIISEGARDISHAKATNELGHNPRPLEESLADLIDWFSKKGLIH